MAAELVAQLRLRLVDDVSGEARRIESAMKLATSGTSAAVEQLRLKQLEASAAARTLQAEHRRLIASGTATEAEIQKVSVALVRARESAGRYAAEARELAMAERSAAQEASRLAAASQVASAQTSRAAATTAAAATRVATSSKAQGRGMVEAMNMVTEMTLGLGGLHPQLRELSIGLAMGGNNAVQMAGAFNPLLAMGLGLATGVLPILITQLANAGDEMEDLGDRTQTAEERFRGLIDAIRSMREEQEAQDRAARGELDVEEQRDRFTARRAEARQARTVRDAAERAAFDQDFSTRQRRPQLIQATRQLVARGITPANARAIADQFRESGQDLGAQGPLRILEAARRLAPVIRGVEQADVAVEEQRRGLELAEQRVQREQAQERVRERPGQIREQLGALATAAGLSEERRSRILQSAERGRLTPEQLRSLGDRGARFRELATELSGAERAAAEQVIEQGSAEDATFTTGPALPPVERVRRAVRPAASAAPSASAPSGPDWARIASSLETLASQRQQPQRVDVNVSVADERARAEVISAPSLTGGQQ